MPGQTGVTASVQRVLAKLGEGAEESPEAQTALALAAVLDDRIGMQNGGSAATAKQFLATMDALRERYQPKQRSGLALILGDGQSA